MNTFIAVHVRLSPGLRRFDVAMSKYDGGKKVRCRWTLQLEFKLSVYSLSEIQEYHR